LKKVHNDWFFGNVTLHLATGGVIQLCSLNVKEGYHIRHIIIQKLISEFEICFHGFGGGAERMSTIDSLYADQCWITNNLSLFYKTVHNKQSSVKSPSKTPVKHQAPPSLVPLYILFRQVCMCLNCGDSNEVIPSVTGRTFTMKSALCEHFQIDPNIVSVLDIRHLYTTITNMIYSDNSSENRLIANSDGAQMNNHSHAIHQRHYATFRFGSHDRMLTAYHAFLGETLNQSDRNFSLTMEPVTQTQQRHALKSLFGQLAEPYNDDQIRMLDLSFNANEKHKFIGLRCGLGKSLSILVPLVNEKISRKGSRCRILVSPYGFLNDSAYESFQSKLDRFLDVISIKSYSGSEIKDKQIPDELTVDNPPDILLLTIDAAANLVKYHQIILRSWKECDLLHGIWFDEIQCLLDEYDFRTVYQQLPLYGAIGVPLTIMSGSFPRQMVESVMTYLNLLPENSNSTTSINQVHSEDIIGSGFHFEVVIVEDVITETMEMITKFQNQTGKSVHAICATKVDCIEFGKRSAENEKTAVAHGDMSKAEISSIAKKWYQSQITTLFSTTIGMVGNENKEMAGLYSVRLPYCLSNLIQVMGRFRPNQRSPPAILKLVLTMKDLKHDEWQTKQADERRNELLHARIIKESDVLAYNQVFHIDGLKDFVNRDGCYIARLRNIFSNSTDNTSCYNCTWCCTGSRYRIYKNDKKKAGPINSINVDGHCNTIQINQFQKSSKILNPYKKAKKQHSPIEMATSAAVYTEQVNINIKNRGEKILAWLKTNCPRCKISGCEGICHKSCLICGENGHLMSNCQFYYKTQHSKELELFLKNKRVCNWCYGLIGNGEMHGVEKGQRTQESRCTLKRRLKCAINMKREQSNDNHAQHLRKIFCSEISFYKFVCSLDIDIMAPTK
jgi:hypothetical protein